MKKDLHIYLDADIHRRFMGKARLQETNASQLVREWIKKYLKGEN